MFVKERKRERERKKEKKYEIHEPTGLQETLEDILTLKNID